jgi:hypothetical protein
MAKITTAGELRQFLCSAINAVGNGTMDTDKARNITKLAAQVTENIYAEAKVAKLQLELGAESERFGELQLGPSSAT